MIFFYRYGGALGMKDPLPTFTTLIEISSDGYPNLACIHVVEARMNGSILATLTDESRARTTCSGKYGVIALTLQGMGRATAIDSVAKYGGAGRLLSSRRNHF